jgi:hypothetical protein
MPHPGTDNTVHHLLQSLPLLLHPLLESETDWHKEQEVVVQLFLGKYQSGAIGIASLVFSMVGGAGMQRVALKINELLPRGSGLGL